MICLGRRDKESARNWKILQSQVEDYTEIFKRLVEANGDSDVGVIVDSYIETEDTNFALYNYVTMQNFERKQLQKDISTYKNEIHSLGNLQVKLSKERTAILTELEKKLEIVSKKRAVDEKSYRQSTNILEQVTMWIERVLTKTKCDLNGLHKILGNEEISVDNMVQFLAAAERQTHEILQLKLVIALKENDQPNIAQLQAAWMGLQNKKQTSHLLPGIVEPYEESSLLSSHPKRGQSDNVLKPVHEEKTRSRSSRSCSRSPNAY